MSQAEQKAKAKQKHIKIDAPSHFGDWHFEVRPALWPALGVSLREYVDKEKTKIAKAEAKKRKESDLSGISILYLSHAVAEHPVLDFHDGDVFPSKKSEGVALQVVAQGENIEVHQIIVRSTPRRLAYHVTDAELAVWLRTGIEPTNARIGKGQSYSEVLRYGIEEPD